MRSTYGEAATGSGPGPRGGLSVLRSAQLRAGRSAQRRSRRAKMKMAALAVFIVGGGPPGHEYLVLDDANVAGAWTLTPWVGLRGIAHAVALPQLLERHPVQRGAVEENVFAPVRGPDEAKAAIGDGFDGALCHGYSSRAPRQKAQAGALTGVHGPCRGRTRTQCPRFRHSEAYSTLTVCPPGPFGRKYAV